MIQNYRDNDGSDPGLGDLAYDGTEYELDEFGERIGSEGTTDEMTEDEMPDAKPAASEQTPSSKVEQGFGETLDADGNPHLSDQLEDDQLNQDAEADYTKPDSMAED